MQSPHVLFSRASLRKAEDQLWKVVLSLLVLLLTLFLILNGANVVPHRDFSWEAHARSARNSVEGVAVQIAPGAGLSQTAEGLSLAAVPPTTVLCSGSASALPVPLDMPSPSILVGGDQAILAVGPTQKDQMVHFDGQTVQWKIRTVELDDLDDGTTLVGSLALVPLPQLLSGDLVLDRLGVSTLSTGVVSSHSVADRSVTLPKILSGALQTILTTGAAGLVAWSQDTSTLTTNTVDGVGPGTLSSRETIGTHAYQLAGAFAVNGQEVQLSASGSTVSGGSTSVGVDLTTTSVASTGVVGLTGSYEWHLECSLQRLTATVGALYTTVTTVASGTTESLLSVATISSVDWDASTLLAIVGADTTKINSVTCRVSTLTRTVPRV